MARARGQSADTADSEDEERDPSAAAEAEARRRRSIAVLTRAGVPVNEHLATIQVEAEIQRRSTEDVALRALALLVVAMKRRELQRSAHAGAGGSIAHRRLLEPAGALLHRRYRAAARRLRADVVAL
ncbi:MAG: DUF4272 domain-containing protein [Dongiaceae bacterium]